MHVPFDGWSEAAFRAAIQDCEADPAQARAHFPRGGVDLALAYHARGDARMLHLLAEHDLPSMRIRDRVALAVRLRLEGADREVVRRGAAFFALPQHATDGARAIWGTADAIWTALGDSSEDGNWYTKRAILSGVYSSTVLYWLGDDSPGEADTWAFLDRRINEVMRFEQAKAQVQKNPVLRTVFALPLAVLGAVRKPAAAQDGLPGRWRPARKAG
ncbi:MAG: COQ9 family protein [Pararhodobacter sp.]|nr:COQ9 family protein [Pararhodobacter sp.]